MKALYYDTKGKLVNSVDHGRPSYEPVPTVYSRQKFNGYQWVIANGGDATTSYSRLDKTYLRSKPGECIAVRQDGSISCRAIECYPYVPFPSIPNLPNLKDDTYVALLNKAAEEYKKFGALTFAGEFRETMRMIRRPALGLRKAIDAYASNAKRAYKRGAGQRGLAESWLEFSFGVKPLISDVKGAVEAFEAMTDKPREFRVAAYNEAVLPPTSFMQQNGWAHVTVYQGYRTDYTATAKAVGVYRTEPSAFHGADRNIVGVSWGDVALTGWELIPWSFLVDYFTSIGDYLNAVVFLSQAKARYASVSTKVSCKRTYIEKRGKDFAKTRYFILTPAEHELETFRFERYRVTNDRVPHPRFTFADKLNANKLFNIAALARLRFP